MHQHERQDRAGAARRVCAWGGLVVALGLVLALLVGRVASDRWHATQYLHWVPAAPVLAGGAGALIVSRLCWGRAGRLRAGRRVGGVALAGVLVWVAMAEWRLLNALGGGGQGEDGAAVAIVHFNAAGKRVPGLARAIGALGGDVVVLTNVRGGPEVAAVYDALSGHDGEAKGDASLYRVDRFTVVSRWAIAEGGSTTLGFEDEVFLNRDLPDLRDPGTAAWVRVMAPGFGDRGLIVWAVDLPSDPSLWRMRVMRQAIEGVRAWNGARDVRGPGGRYARAEAGAGERGFPEPDVVIGDFNTPGGSAALAWFAEHARTRGGMRDAYAAAGSGGDGSFPGMAPRWLGWGIDRALVRDGLAVRAYGLRRIGRALHRAQRVVVAGDTVGTGTTR